MAVFRRVLQKIPFLKDQRNESARPSRRKHRGKPDCEFGAGLTTSPQIRARVSSPPELLSEYTLNSGDNLYAVSRRLQVVIWLTADTRTTRADAWIALPHSQNAKATTQPPALKLHKRPYSGRLTTRRHRPSHGDATPRRMATRL